MKFLPYLPTKNFGWLVPVLVRNTTELQRKQLRNGIYAMRLNCFINGLVVGMVLAVVFYWRFHAC